LSAATRKRKVRTAVAIRRNEASLAAERRIETDGMVLVQQQQVQVFSLF
jgi:hypothetical protein